MQPPLRRRAVRPSTLVLLALLAAGAPALQGAAAAPFLVPGEPIQEVHLASADPVVGGAMGCVGVVQLTLVRRGTSFPAVLASEGPEGCASDLCEPFHGNPEVECREDEVLGVYSTNVVSAGVDVAWSPVACLRNAAFHLDVDGDGGSDAPPLDLVTVTTGPC